MYIHYTLHLSIYPYILSFLLIRWWLLGANYTHNNNRTGARTKNRMEKKLKRKKEEKRRGKEMEIAEKSHWAHIGVYIEYCIHGNGGLSTLLFYTSHRGIERP